MQPEWCGQSQVVGTLNPYLLSKKNELARSGSAGTKTLGASPRAFYPKSHLVIPNIVYIIHIDILRLQFSSSLFA